MNTLPANETQNGSAISKDVVLRLNEMIQSGAVQPGERLPAERDLAKILGVSHPTVRNGIRSLIAIGMLRSRPGAGTYVVESSASPSLDSSPLSLLATLHGFTSGEMFEAGVSLETFVAELAATRATSEHLTLMAEECAGMFASLDEPEQFLAHEMKFHQAVANASDNRILNTLMRMVTDILLLKKKPATEAADLKVSATMHHRIYRAIRERNTQAAGLAMNELLSASPRSNEIDHET